MVLSSVRKVSIWRNKNERPRSQRRWAANKEREPQGL